MRKHNEGYTLPLVLVVMIVLSLVALGVMSVSLHNLKAQTASIQRLESKYAAQGELEKAVARLAKVLTEKQAATANEMEDQEVTPQDAAQAIFIDALGVGEDSCVKLQKRTDGSGNRDPEWTEKTSGALSCTIFLYVTDPEEQVGITCSIYLENVLVPKNGQLVYFYNNSEIIYTSYEIGGAAG